MLSLTNPKAFLRVKKNESGQSPSDEILGDI